MAVKSALLILLAAAAIRAQQEKYCTEFLSKLKAFAQEGGGGIPDAALPRLQKICEKAITCTEEGCRGPFVRDERHCAACSSIIVTFMDNELSSAKKGSVGGAGELSAILDEKGIKVMLPEPHNCAKLGNAYCKWQDRLQECAAKNNNNEVPREDCYITDPCKFGFNGHCDEGFRTINGVPVDVPTERPWLAAFNIKWFDHATLSSKGPRICGGAYIAKNVVVTARHCVHKDNWEITKGQVSMGDNRSNPRHRGRWRTFTGDDVRILSMDADIAVVILKNEQPVDNFRTVDLPPADVRLTKGDLVQIAGWGVTCKNPPVCTQQSQYAGEVQKPEEVTIPVSCVAAKEKNYNNCGDRKYQFSAGGIDDKGFPADACAGDSGSPLVVDADGPSPYLGGVVSNGPELCGFKKGFNVDVTIPVIRNFLLDYAEPYPPPRPTPRVEIAANQLITEKPLTNGTIIEDADIGEIIAGAWTTETATADLPMTQEAAPEQNIVTEPENNPDQTTLSTFEHHEIVEQEENPLLDTEYNEEIIQPSDTDALSLGDESTADNGDGLLQAANASHQAPSMPDELEASQHVVEVVIEELVNETTRGQPTLVTNNTQQTTAAEQPAIEEDYQNNRTDVPEVPTEYGIEQPEEPAYLTPEVPTDISEEKSHNTDQSDDSIHRDRGEGRKSEVKSGSPGLVVKSKEILFMSVLINSFNATV